MFITKKDTDYLIAVVLHSDSEQKEFLKSCFNQNTSSIEFYSILKSLVLNIAESSEYVKGLIQRLDNEIGFTESLSEIEYSDFDSIENAIGGVAEINKVSGEIFEGVVKSFVVSSLVKSSNNLF